MQDVLLNDWVIRELKEVGIPFGQKSILKGQQALMAWQYVRFNRQYREEYRTLGEDRYRNSKRTEGFCAAWGIPIPLDYHEDEIPDGFFFQRVTVFPVTYDDSNRAEYLLSAAAHEFRKQNSIFSPLILVIERNADEKTILEQVRNILRNDHLRKRFMSSDLKVKGSATSRLLENLLCYYFYEVQRKSPKEIKSLLSEYTGIHSRFGTAQLKGRVKTFLEWSSRSPGIFFQVRG